MTNRTALILFILGFILWYANRKKTATIAPIAATSSTTNSGQFLVASGSTTQPVTPTVTVPIVVTPVQRMVNGVPVWLKSLGNSHSGSTNETSLWIEADIIPDVQWDIVGGGAASGIGWMIGAANRALAYSLRNWNSVDRKNPTVNGIGGILNNKEYYVKLTNPDAVTETITVKLKTANGDSVGIESIPIIPVTIPTNVVVTPPIVVPPNDGNPTPDLNAIMGPDVPFVGELKKGYSSHPEQFDFELVPNSFDGNFAKIRRIGAYSGPGTVRLKLKEDYYTPEQIATIWIACGTPFTVKEYHSNASGPTNWDDARLFASGSYEYGGVIL